MHRHPYTLLSIALLALLIITGSRAPSPPAPQQARNTTLTPSAFQSFEAEAIRVAEAIRCPGNIKIIPAQVGMGSLYSCIRGDLATAKVFVNEARVPSGTVHNIKVMWNDWRFDTTTAYKHADQEEAQQNLTAVANLYTPDLLSALLDAMRGDRTTQFQTDKYSVRYTFHRGPGIDERMFTFTSP